MEFTIKLDLDTESDRKLLELITNYKASIAKGEHPTTFVPSPESVFPKTRPMAQVGSQVNRAADALASQIGAEPKKMSTKERASLAAKTRWEKARLSKENSTAPALAARAKKKAAPRKELDLSSAQEVNAAQFPSQNAQDMILNSFEQPPYPDGREIMEGTFHKRFQKINGQEVEPLDDEEEPEEDPLGDEDIDAIRERARKYEEEGNK